MWLLTGLILMTLVGAPEAKQEVLLDNERVLMVRNTYPPGTESGVHNHPHEQRAVYVVAGGELMLTPADSEQPSRTITVKTGMALMLPAQKHNVTNVGETTVILLETELK